jgi:hypothetical protein
VKSHPPLLCTFLTGALRAWAKAPPTNAQLHRLVDALVDSVSAATIQQTLVDIALQTIIQSKHAHKPIFHFVTHHLGKNPSAYTFQPTKGLSALPDSVICSILSFVPLNELCCALSCFIL